MKTLNIYLDRLIGENTDCFEWIRPLGESAGKIAVTGICRDNRKVEPGNLFVCIKGVHFDTHTCLKAVEAAGAVLALIDSEADLSGLSGAMAILRVPNTRAAEALLECEWYDDPAKKMKTVIGITGSKGKTTITHMIADILRENGNNVGTIGSNGAIFGSHLFELANTTPDADEIQKYLQMMVEAGCDTVVMECSSQGLMQHRLDGITFDYGIFTNISAGDHVSPIEHKSFGEYLACKSILLQNSRKVIAYSGDIHIDAMMKKIGGDDGVIFYGRHEKEPSEFWVERELIGKCADAESGLCILEGRNGDCELIGSNNDSYFTTSSSVVTDENGEPVQKFTVCDKVGNTSEFCTNLPGDFNVTNALCAISLCRELGVGDETMNRALTSLSISGRMEMVYESDKFRVCVDFAHNGYSTRKLLTALREYSPERLICIFGADGNRSISRRTQMGEASGRLADLSIVTSGHNRWESFEAISKDILEYLIPTGGAYKVIKDRKEAIRYVIANVKQGDLITIIGMGHEHYQEENGVKTPYSDKDFVLQVIKEAGYEI